MRYDWTGWEPETDLGNNNDRAGVWYLTITEEDEEYAIIIHRSRYEPHSVEAGRKEERAQRIVDALNLFDQSQSLEGK